jgi:hypothetical protein
MVAHGLVVLAQAVGGGLGGRSGMDKSGAEASQPIDGRVETLQIIARAVGGLSDGGDRVCQTPQGAGRLEQSRNGGHVQDQRGEALSCAAPRVFDPEAPQHRLK